RPPARYARLRWHSLDRGDLEDRHLPQVAAASGGRSDGAVAMILGALALTLALQRPAAWPAFTRSFDDYVAHDSIVGASVLIVRDGKVVAWHEVGWANRAAGWRTDTNTIYHWASITKTLTAIAILQLRDRGRLSLDDPITRWVPEL